MSVELKRYSHLGVRPEKKEWIGLDRPTAGLPVLDNIPHCRELFGTRVPSFAITEASSTGPPQRVCWTYRIQTPRLYVSLSRDGEQLTNRSEEPTYSSSFHDTHRGASSTPQDPFPLPN
jgi:hypothetical protein